MNRVHWPSLLITLLLLLAAIWAILHMPAGPEAFCVARGGEWFEELGRCL